MCEFEFAKLPIELKRWIIATTTELSRAEIKHPDWPEDKIHAAAIVAEESGELVRAALNYEYEGARYYDMHTEAIQTAATCFRFVLNAPDLVFYKCAPEKNSENG